MAKTQFRLLCSTPLGDERTGKVTVVLDAKRDYNKWLWDGRRDMKTWDLPEYVVVDSEGNVQKATVEDADVKFGYDLPDDKFRQPYMARQVKVSLFAEKLPALGYRTYALVPAEAVGTAGKGSNIASDDRHLENEFLKVTINDDGTLNVLDKQTGKTYEGLGYFEDTLDAGNEYIYFCPKGNPAIVTKGTKAEIKLVENTDFGGKRGSDQCADRSGFRRRSVKGRAGRSCRIHEAYLRQKQ